ncbi:hypothetical protein HJ590_09830 [Naumannella sp. ID2617S]|nr:hypothetical protein [Naumannella sp. ID2617S]
MKIRTSAALAATVLVAATGCSSQTADARETSLFGAWTMTSLEASTNGQFQQVPYSGQIIFTEPGRMSTRAKNLVPNAPDTDYTVGGYESYYGAVSVDEAANSFTVRSESSSSNVLVGREAVRNYRITDDVLVITPKDESEGWRVTHRRVPK